ncbi:MAG: HAD-IIIA family hydrolase [Lachnospiraceae bacterium]|nr:HAD-IIIA family hydrolase [Lachnospiraceae bacterium]
MSTAVIMAGGKGTRLQSIAKDIPKPMFPILGKPILEYQIDSLKRSGIIDIILIIGYLGDMIRDHFGDGETYGVNIRYIAEDKPLGSAGSLYYLKADKSLGIAEGDGLVMKEDFFLVFGDLLLDIDWNRFISFHKQRRGLVTLYVHSNTHPYDSDVIVVDTDDRVLRIEPKNMKRDFFYHNLVNAGVYCISPRLLDGISDPVKMDFEKELVAPQVINGTVYAYKSTEYVKDMGTPERLQAVSEDVRNGIVESRSLRNKQKAIFLDRDGTINVFKGFLRKAEDFELYPDTAEAIRRINTSEYLAIVVTNQPVVARGECSYEELEQIHAKMETLLGKAGVYIDDLFFCPHHPDKGFAGEILELKINCDCRKPKIGMLVKAAKRYNIDLERSWYIGDSTLDIQTGMNAQMKTVLLKTGVGGLDGKFDVRPEFVADNLLEAVTRILE